jgi:hypothetical protein
VSVEAGLGLLGGAGYGRAGFFEGSKCEPFSKQTDFFELEQKQVIPGSLEDRAFNTSRTLLEGRYKKEFEMYKVIYYMSEPGVEPIYYFKA